MTRETQNWNATTVMALTAAFFSGIFDEREFLYVLQVLVECSRRGGAEKGLGRIELCIHVPAHYGLDGQVKAAVNVHDRHDGPPGIVSLVGHAHEPVGNLVLDFGQQKVADKARQIIRDNLAQISPVFTKQKFMLGEEYQMIAGSSVALSAPTVVSLTARTAGSNETSVGANANFTVFVTATNYYGETTAAQSSTISTSSGQVVDLVIGPVTGAQSYNVYVSTNASPTRANAWRVVAGVGGGVVGSRMSPPGVSARTRALPSGRARPEATERNNLGLLRKRTSSARLARGASSPSPCPCR